MTKRFCFIFLFFTSLSSVLLAEENQDYKIFYLTQVNDSKFLSVKNNTQPNIIKQTNLYNNNETTKNTTTNDNKNTGKQQENAIKKDSSSNNSNDKNKSNNNIVSIYGIVGLGTTGLDIGASVYYKNFIGIRANYAFMPSSVLSFLNNTISSASSNITNSKSSFSAGGLDLSIRPFFGAFRVDVGMRFMNYSVSVNAFQGIDNPYVQNAGVGGYAKFVMAEGVKPYFGLGWDWNPFLGFTIGFDVGIIYTGQWKMAKMDADIVYGNMTPEQREQFDANFGTQIEDAKQVIQDVKKDVNNKIPSFLKFWPVIKLNVGWKFNI